MTIELYQYEPFGPRVWELRQNVLPYDAWYVAVAEELARPLMTLDSQLARASGPLCQFVLPP